MLIVGAVVIAAIFLGLMSLVLGTIIGDAFDIDV